MVYIHTYRQHSLSLFLILKKAVGEADEMIQLLRALVFLAEGHCFVASTQGCSQPSVTPVQGIQGFLLTSSTRHTRSTHLYYTCRQNTHIKINL